MKFATAISLMTFFLMLFSVNTPLYGNDLSEPLTSSQSVSFFHPTGMNGFIVYDEESGDNSSGLSYGRQSFDLSRPLGLPVKVEVEGLNISENSDDVRQILEGSQNHTLEIFSIRHALAYGSKSLLSPFHPGKRDITMVVASANYQASERLSATVSTGLTQTVKEQDDSAATLGYDLDISGLYQIAPGLSFSVGAGYSTQMDRVNDPDQNQENNNFWSLTSKLRLKF